MTQVAEFQERLNRINRGEQFVADHLVTKDVYQRRRRRRKQIQASALYSFVLLFLVGMISVMMIRYGRFQIFGIDRADITSLEGMILDGGGSLLMEWRETDGIVTMTGPTTHSFSGVWEMPDHRGGTAGGQYPCA